MLSLVGHAKSVRTVAFCPDGRLVSGGEDRTVKIWNVADGAVVETIAAKRIVFVLAVAPEGNTIAWSGRPRSYQRDRNSISTWSLKNRQPEYEFDWPMGDAARSIWSLSFSGDGRYLAAASRRPGGGNVPEGAGGHWWDRRNAARHADLSDPRIYSLAFETNSSKLAVSREKAVDLYEKPDGEPKIGFPQPSDWAEGVALLPGSSTVAIGVNSFLCFFDPAAPSKGDRIKTGIRRITALALSPDGRQLAIGGRAPEGVEVYSLPERKLLAAFDFKLEGVNAIAYSPDGLTFAVAGERGLIVCDSQ